MRFLHIKRFSTISSHLVDYPTPIIGYTNSFGSLIGFFFFMQIVTGVYLATQFTPHISFAFESIEAITRDVNQGWLVRYIHSNGASMFFILMYIHLFRNAYECEYNMVLWYSGIVLFLITMAVAFMGYILPWGQMSFWGVTVITNLLTTIPYVGVDLAQWVWGGYSVANPTLNRFFSFHFVIPFILAGFAIVHITLLHFGSSTDDEDCEIDKVTFYPYYYTKDIFVISLACVWFGYLIYFKSNILGHSDNYILAITNVTPVHLVPEWYFLPFYSLLRSTPNKFGGLVIMGYCVYGMFAYEPHIGFTHIDEVATNVFTADYISPYWAYEDPLAWILSGWMGSQDLEEPYSDIAMFLTSWSFLEFVPEFYLIRPDLFYDEI